MHPSLYNSVIKRLLSVFIILFSLFSDLNAQIVISGATPTQMVQNLVGPGIIFSNVTFTGDPNLAAAIFSNGYSTNLGLGSGVVLTTGSANLIPVNNSGSEGTNNSGGALPELNTIAGATTYDGVVLEFDFIPLGPQINVNYIFGSEEYLEFVNGGFNDAFAFFISGPGIVPVGGVNIATVSGQPVTIDNVNTTTNSAFFINNTGSSGPNSIEYDGFTTVLTATRTVIPCSTYHIKLMIADGGDGIYDSGVFIQENGFFTPNNVLQVAVQPSYNFGSAIEGCQGSQFVFNTSTAVLAYTDITYTVGGTAIAGQDYVPFPTTVTLAPGQSSVSLPINIIDDGVAEGQETITITVQTSPCSTQTFTMNINDPTPINLSATGASMCAGSGPVTISANATGGNGPITYSWNNGAGNGSSVSVNPATTTTYTVTATDQCGKTATTTATVTVTPGVTSTFTTVSPICQGSTSTITYTGNAGPGATYNWNFGGGTAIPGGNTAGPHTVTWAGSGTQNLSLTVIANGCTSSVSNQNVVVNPTPAAPILGSNAPICSGSTLNLTANTIAGATYVWNGPNGFTSNAEDPSIPNTTSAMSGSYSAYVVVNGCTSSTALINVIINNTPSAPTIGSNSPICDGGTLNLTSNTIAGATYVWSGPNSFSSNLEDPSITNMTQNQAGTYSAYVVVSGCTSAVSTTDVIIAPPVAPSLSSNSPVCVGGTLNLTATVVPGATYVWSGPNGFNAGTATPSITNVSTNANGTYSAYMVVGGCTTTTVTTDVIINPLPAAPVLNSNTPICEGVDLNLTANTTAGATYVWSGPNGFSSNLEDPTIANATTGASGNYSAYIVVNGCTSATANTNVVVNAIPQAPTISSDASLCEGQTLNLSSNTIAGATYVWSGPDNFSSNMEDPSVPNINSISAGDYDAYVVVNGCTSSVSTLTVQITPPPTADFAITPQVCLGDDAFALYNGNAPQNATYTWTTTNGGTITGSGQGPITFNWNVAGNQDITLEVSINGCNSGPNTQTVNVLQSVIPNAGPDQSLCSGESITLGEPAQNGVTYQWLTPNGINDPNDPNSSGTWTNNGNTVQTYTLTLQAQSNGCTATDETIITVIPNPSASFIAPPNQCLSGNSFSFTAGGTYLPQATFDWSFANANPANSALQNPTGIQFTQSGTHDVSLTVSQLGCTSTFSSSITVSDGPIAGFTYQPGQGCIPLTVTFTDQTVPTAPDYSYSWHFGDGGTSNTASPVHTYTQAGVFDVSLTVTNAAGCQSTYTQNGIIKVYNAPVAGFSANPQTVYIDQPITTIIDGSVGNVSNWTYLVSDGSVFNSPNFTLNFQQIGTYTIIQTVSDGFGCDDQATLIVEVLPVSEIFVPSAFTPGNNDNLNELFKAVGTNLNDFKMYIFNRWGEIVFTSMDINEGWNGNIRNSEVQAKPDVYVWMIEYLDHKGIATQKHGRITVVR